MATWGCGKWFLQLITQRKFDVFFIVPHDIHFGGHTTFFLIASMSRACACQIFQVFVYMNAHGCIFVIEVFKLINLLFLMIPRILP